MQTVTRTYTTATKSNPIAGHNPANIAQQKNCLRDNPRQFFLRTASYSFIIM